MERDVQPPLEARSPMFPIGTDRRRNSIRSRFFTLDNTLLVGLADGLPAIALFQTLKWPATRCVQMPAKLVEQQT